jgi:hypothetical protein
VVDRTLDQRHRRLRAVAPGLVAVCLAVSAAGCGDDDRRSEPPASTAPVTQASPTTPPPSTSTPTEVTTAVTRAFETFFDGKSTVDARVAVLQDGERYRQMLTDAAADARFASLTTAVRAVREASTEECAEHGASERCAVVTHDLLVAGLPMGVGVQSLAVAVGDRWLVAASAWCGVVAMGGATCP